MPISEYATSMARASTTSDVFNAIADMHRREVLDALIEGEKAVGVPAADVERMRPAIHDMWSDGPGGWVPEWSALAAGYAEKGDHYLASLIYGCAKFPCLADAQREAALTKQVEEHVAASPSFPVRFERRVLSVPYLGAKIEVPVHIYATVADYTSSPMLLISGGVDTWKMDIHSMCVSAATHSGATVLAFDIPGTGELTRVPLNADADDVVLGLVDAARALGNAKVGHIALSFGGNYSAMTGLTGAGGAARTVRELAHAGRQRSRRLLHPPVRHTRFHRTHQHRGASDRGNRPRRQVKTGHRHADDDRLAATAAHRAGRRPGAASGPGESFVTSCTAPPPAWRDG
jgi:FrsA-like alpha/beta hydrolase family protein